MDSDKKIYRKRRRFVARLKSSCGLICTDLPTSNIVICNAGQATGFDKDALCQLINQYDLGIATPKTIFEKGESHSFLIFKNVEDAAVFYTNCNGKGNNGTPLYLSYVDKVPNAETLHQGDNPAGLIVLTDFISKEEENHFISLFDCIDDSSNLKNRQVKHYGFEFRYGSNDVDINSPLSEKIPQQCDLIWNRLKEKGYNIGVPDQLTVNKYTPGQGIPSHVDKHSPFGNTILSLSLGSAVVMDWKHHSGKYVPIELQPRTLLIMQGEARYDWQHGIQPRTWDPVIESRIDESSQKYMKVVTSDTIPRQTRISLTFRWTRTGPCDCYYKTLCDSVQRPQTDIEDEVAANLEQLHVHQVYEQIADHFSTTRHKPWPKVVEFMEQVPTGAVVLDLGCGNGKNILKRSDIVQIGGERSSGLLEECKRHIRHVPGADCVRLDLLATALTDQCADIIICIAVVHHFSSKVRRLQSLSTIARLLRTGGRALVTVWAKDQTNSNYLQKTKTQNKNEEMVSVAGVNLPIHENRTQFQHNDLLVPWKLRTKTHNKLSSQPIDTLLRYYHVFQENELESLCEQLPSVVVENTFYEEGNWCVIFKKIQ